MLKKGPGVIPQEIAERLEELAGGQIRVKPDQAGYRGVVSDESLLEFHFGGEGSPLYFKLATALREIAETLNDLADLVEQRGEANEPLGEEQPQR